MAEAGSSTMSTYRMNPSSMSSAIRAPSTAPSTAPAAANRDTNQRMRPLFPYRYTLTAVPMDMHILLVPNAKWVGSPASRNAGRLMVPPPPAMASHIPARNSSGHTINSCFTNSDIVPLRYKRYTLSRRLSTAVHRMAHRGQYSHFTRFLKAMRRLAVEKSIKSIKTCKKGVDGSRERW